MFSGYERYIPGGQGGMMDALAQLRANGYGGRPQGPSFDPRSLPAFPGAQPVPGGMGSGQVPGQGFTMGPGAGPGVPAMRPTPGMPVGASSAPPIIDGTFTEVGAPRALGAPQAPAGLLGGPAAPQPGLPAVRPTPGLPAVPGTPGGFQPDAGTAAKLMALGTNPAAWATFALGQTVKPQPLGANEDEKLAALRASGMDPSTGRQTYPTVASDSTGMGTSSKGNPADREQGIVSATPAQFDAGNPQGAVDATAPGSQKAARAKALTTPLPKPRPADLQPSKKDGGMSGFMDFLSGGSKDPSYFADLMDRRGGNWK